MKHRGRDEKQPGDRRKKNLHLTDTWVIHHLREVWRATTAFAAFAASASTTELVRHISELRVVHDVAHCVWVGHDILCHLAHHLRQSEVNMSAV